MTMNIGEVCGSLAIQQAKITNTFRSETAFETILGQLREIRADRVGAAETQGAEGAEGAGLEEMLRAKYKNLSYHVFDASTGYWKTRNDYPHYMLFSDRADVSEKLSNWEPQGKNPVYSPFEAPPEINALGGLKPGSKAVIIHPKVQEKMEADPGYAKEIYDRIEAWFAFDLARNDALEPGYSVGMCQAVAIGEDGNIANAMSCNPLRNEMTYSGDPEEVKARMKEKAARQEYFMQLQIDGQIQRKINMSELYAAAALDGALSAKENVLSMMNDGSFRAALGESVGGVSVDRIFEITKASLFGNKPLS